MARPGITRRTFVSDLAASAGAFTIVPRHVLGGPRHRAPSDTLAIACIGVGGMGRNDVRNVSSEHVYALCDVDARNLEAARLDHPDARTFVDYREMFAREAEHIDLVTVSTPDHSHAAATMLALELGKHVYTQKPLARTIHEVRALREAARASEVATQMGNQGHAGDGTRLIREWVEAGVIGTVREVHYWTNRPIWPQAIDRPLEQYYVPPHINWDLWIGPAPFRPYHPRYAPFNWRGWWDFGTGALGDIACHAMDAAFWTMDLAYPQRITAETTQRFPETAPATSRIVYDFPARSNRPPVTVVWRDGGLQPPLTDELASDPNWSWEGIGGQLWIGDDGKLVAGVYGEDPRVLDPARQAELTASPLPVVYPRSPGVHEEWIAAARTGGQAMSSFDGHAGPLTEMVLLGNLAVRTGRPITLNPGNGEVLTTGIPEEYLVPTYREGWHL